MNPFLESIKRIRAQKGYSQEFMAKKLNIATANYGKIERGLTQMTVERLQTISDILGESIIVILGGPSDYNDKVYDYEKLLEKQKQDHNSIMKLNSEIEDLKRQIEDKSLLIEMFKKEKISIKERLVEQLIENYSMDIENYNNQISNTMVVEEKEKLNTRKENLKESFRKQRERYIKAGFLTQSDFDNYYMELKAQAEIQDLMSDFEF